MRRIFIAPILALTFLAPACGTEAAGGVGKLVTEVVTKLKGVNSADTAKSAATSLGPIVDKLKTAFNSASKAGDKATGDAGKAAGDMAKKATDAAKKAAGGMGAIFAPLKEQVTRIMANKDWAAPLKGVMDKLKSFVPGMK